MGRPVAALLGLVLLVTGCSSGGEPGADRSQFTLVTERIGQGLDPAAPQVTNYLRAFGAAEALMKIQADGSVQPELAESMEQTTPTRWTVTLREGARFWSGAPVDAQAVVASLRRSGDLNAVAADFLQDVRFTAAGPRTVQFDTTEPSEWLPYALAHYSLVIYNAERYGARAGAVPAQQADLTGPFRVRTFEPGTTMVLERNQYWWGPPPSVNRIVVREVADEQARTQTALSGQAQIVAEIPAERAQEIDDSGAMAVQASPQANTVAVYLNPRSASAPALADQRVRQALAWAVDRQELAEIAGEGLTVPASSWLASNPSFPQADQQGYPQRDQQRAAALLTEAGWRRDGEGDGGGRWTKDGRPLSLRLLTWGSEKATGEVLQAQWDRFGVSVDLSYVDDTVIEQALDGGDWDALTQAWTTVGAVPSLIATQIAADGSANHSGLTVPQVPELLAQAQTDPSEQRRTEALLTINKLMAQTVPSIPVHPRVDAVAVSPQLRGFVAHPLQYENIVQPSMTLG